MKNSASKFDRCGVFDFCNVLFETNQGTTTVSSRGPTGRGDLLVRCTDFVMQHQEIATPLRARNDSAGCCVILLILQMHHHSPFYVTQPSARRTHS